MAVHTSIGRYEQCISDIAAEYRRLAQEDETVGHYLLVQAMEKYTRPTIFGLVNPNAAYIRERTRTHDLDRLLEFLVEIVGTNQPCNKITLA
jgi:hypothetical protein